MDNTQRRMRPAEAIYHPEPERRLEQLPPAQVWLAEEEQPLQVMWDRALFFLRLTLPRMTFEERLQGSKLLAIDGDVATIQAKDSLAAEWLAVRIKERIERQISKVVDRPLTARIVAP